MSEDYTTAFSVDASPHAVFEAVNNPRRWWSEEIVGDTEQVGDEFEYHFEELHRCTIRVTESVPDRHVEWLVVKNYFSFVQDSAEWTDTTITFDISEVNGKTRLLFTHHGLVPQFECYDACSEGWGNYINGSLQKLITEGTGMPHAAGTARTSAEESLGSASR